MNDVQEYPKWVKPHDSLIVKQGDNIVVPEFEQCHVNRVNAEVTVLVNDAEEEAKATGAGIEAEVVPAETEKKD